MIEITYLFKFSEQEQLKYKCGLHNETLGFIPLEENDSTDSSWTQLEHNQCENCPLTTKQSQVCPIAANLCGLVNFFKDTKSYKKATVCVMTQERSYMKQGSVQEGLFSIFGLIMATSGCPHMNFFRTMARYHLPFSTPEETIYRATSAYLLQQYFKKVDRPNLDGLVEIYKNVDDVNRGMLARIKSLGEGDADLNAIVLLNNFGQLLNIEVDMNLSSLEKLFKS